MRAKINPEIASENKMNPKIISGNEFSRFFKKSLTFEIIFDKIMYQGFFLVI